MISDKAYERSCRLALENGYKEIKNKKDVFAYRGSYFIKNGKKWIHDIGYLMKDFQKRGHMITSDLDLEKFGYNVDDYYQFNDTEMENYIAELENWQIQEQLYRQDMLGEICQNENIDIDEVDDIYEYIEQRGYNRLTLRKSKRDEEWEESQTDDFLINNNTEEDGDEIDVINNNVDIINTWKNPKELQRLINNKLKHRQDGKIFFPKKRKVFFN